MSDGVSLGGGASSQAEFDPHAFLFWKPADLAVIPLRTYAERGQTFNGAVGFKLGSASIAEAGRISHPAEQGGYTPDIGRSVVIGDTLYTLSYAGLAANRLDGLAPLSFTAFPRTPRPEPVNPGPLPASQAQPGP